MNVAVTSVARPRCRRPAPAPVNRRSTPPYRMARPRQAAAASSSRLDMTYCVAMLLDDGLVFLSDSRTNAGVDQISTFRKMHVFEKPGERVLVLLTAGNLAITQAVVSLLRAALRDRGSAGSTWTTCPTCSTPRAGRRALREVHRRDAPALASQDIEFNAALHPRRPDRRRAAAAVPHLRGRQFHRGDGRHAVLPDRRVQVRQADHRSRRHAQHQPRRGGEVRADLDGLDHPLEPVGRPAARPGLRATRHAARAAAT